MGPLDREFAPSNLLFVTDGNVLEDSVEAVTHRELCRALTGLGISCAVVCRFLVPGEQETDPGPWLAERRWALEASWFPGSAGPGGGGLRVSAGGVPVTLLQGLSTRPHVPDDAERTAFLRLVEAAIQERHPDVVVARSGPSLADVLAAARARHLGTVALQPDCTPRESVPFSSGDVVLTPTRFAAEYLREALGLPCANLPPVVPLEQVPTAPPKRGAVVFDGSTAGAASQVVGQIAEEIGRRRPDIPLLFLGGTGPIQLPRGGRIPAVSARALGQVWGSARVLVAPLGGWEHTPLAALSAIGHGVPVLASDRGATPEVLDGNGVLFALPDRLTPAMPVLLNPAELAPWVETILRLYEDPVFAARLRSQALLARERMAPEKLARQYAIFFAGLAGQRGRTRTGPIAVRTDAAAALRRLAEAHPWPTQRPADAAPGQEPGWLDGGTEQMLVQALSPTIQLVVELGAWLGLSTRFIARHAPGATVVSVDHWRGSPEHQHDERYRTLLPRLYETFLARCWDERGRIVPLRTNTLEGLRAVAAAGLQPDLVYVDAEHSCEAVTTELSLARQLFPKAALVGDGYDWSSVRKAVDGFARRQGLVVERFGVCGWRLLENWEAGAARQPPPGRGQSVVLVPHLNGIEWECEQGLRQLEGAGVRVVRRGGCSQIDIARNELLSDALHDGAETMLFIDADTGFDAQDAVQLLARPEPVIAGIYAKKGRRELASVFADEVKEVLFGPDVVGAYPLKYAATGFLRIQAEVLRRLIAELRLPLCNTHWGRGVWPFFLPLIVPHGEGKLHYLGEDWAFSYRLAQIGVTPMADTSIRLWHWGRYSYGWEDAGSVVHRYRSYSYRLTST